MNEKKYSKNHEWISLNDKIGTIGISDHAQESLGDIVFIDLPEVGKNVTSGSEVSVIESVKAASDIYSPVDGKIVEVNENLTSDPSIINKDPENEGWIFKILLSDISQVDNLMNYHSYKNLLKNE